MPSNKDGQRKSMALGIITSNIANELMESKSLIALVERLLSSEMSNVSISVLDGYIDKLSDQHNVLEELPNEVEEFIRASKRLGAEDVVEDNILEIQKYLEDQEYEIIKNHMFSLIGRANVTVNTHRTISESSTPTYEDSHLKCASLSQQPEQPVHGKNKEQLVFSSNKSPGASGSIGRNKSSSTKQAMDQLSGESSCLNQHDNYSEEQLQLLRRLDAIEENQNLLLRQYGFVVNENWKRMESVQPPTRGFGQTQHENPVFGKNENSGNCWKSNAEQLEYPAEIQATHAATQAVMVNSPNIKVTEKSSPLLNTNLIMSIINAIPVFDGKKENYHLFMQSFNMLVHNRNDIEVEMKHTLLLKLLNEETRDMMRSSDISAEGYETLRNNLDRQFAREKDSKIQLIEQIQHFAFEEEDFDKMEKDLNRYCVLVNMLKINGCRVDDAFFLENFVCKLPEKIMAQVYKKNRERVRTFQEIVGIAYDTLSEKKALEKAREKKEHTKYTTEVYTMEAGGSASPEQENGEEIEGYQDEICHYCDSTEHLALQCPLSLQDKLKAVEAKELCYNCLGPNHARKWCTSKNNCGICGGRHYTAHCQKRNDGNSKFFRASEDGTSENQ